MELAARTCNLVLWIDLALDHQVREADIRAQVGDATIFRLTQFGVAPCPRGAPPSWTPVLIAIDKMLEAARPQERDGAGCRYWVTGRAGLPAFVYLGVQLSAFSNVTFLHAPEDGAALIPLALPAGGARAPTSAPYFEAVPSPPRAPNGVPALVILSLNHGAPRPDDRQISEALAGTMRSSGAIARYETATRLDATNAAAASHEVFVAVRSAATARPTGVPLAVFVGGPSSLACLVGRALSPGICRDVQVFEYRGGAYVRAYDLPFPPVPTRGRVLLISAQADGERELELERELREVGLTTSAGLEVAPCPAARPHDVLEGLRSRPTGALHVSSHGLPGELELRGDGGAAAPLTIGTLASILRTQDPPVRLVTLSACHSAHEIEELLGCVECVIAMRGSVDDEDARRFAAALYRELATGHSVARAFDQAKLEVHLRRSAKPDSARTRDFVTGTTAPREDGPFELRERSPGLAERVFLVAR